MKKNLEEMTREELIAHAKNLELDTFSLSHVRKENKRLKEILSAVGIAYETYQNEFNRDNNTTF